MGQNMERCRPMEIDPLMTVVQEMGRLTGTPRPAIDSVAALPASAAEWRDWIEKRSSYERSNMRDDDFRPAEFQFCRNC